MKLKPVEGNATKWSSECRRLEGKGQCIQLTIVELWIVGREGRVEEKLLYEFEVMKIAFGVKMKQRRAGAIV